MEVICILCIIFLSVFGGICAYDIHKSQKVLNKTRARVKQCEIKKKQLQQECTDLCNDCGL